MPDLRSSAANRALAAELRRLREHAGISGDELAGDLRWSASKVSRIETNRTGVKRADLIRLLKFYGLDQERQSQLAALAAEPEPRGWWNAYGSHIEPEYAAYISMEANAGEIRCWSPSLIHGLLQTEEYAKAIMAVSSTAEPEVPRVVIQNRIEVRLRRQEILRAGQPSQISFVLDEATLLHQFGDSGVMRGQLQRLQEVTRLRGVAIRVLAFAGKHPVVMQGSFALMKFPPVHGTAIDDIVYLENLTRDELIEDPKETFWYERAFSQLEREALDEKASLQLIGRVAKDIWSS